ncbi:ATP-binding protein [Burkholderia pseudomallei]
MATTKKKTTSPVKRKAPVGNTGGSGFSFENSVAARFMLDLLGHTHTLGAKTFGKVVRLDWQVRDRGWLFDDLVVTSRLGVQHRNAGISIKSGQKVTVRGFPSEFVRTAWAQWFNEQTTRPFARTADVAVLVTGKGTQAARNPWDRLLREVLDTSSDRIVDRLSDAQKNGQQFSTNERGIFKSFACPQAFRTKHTGDEETVDLIRQVRWLNFDYDSPTSQDYATAIVDCKQVLSDTEADRADELWIKLRSLADDKRKVGGTIDLPSLLTALHAQFKLRDNPDYGADWAAIKSRSDAELSGIKTEIAGLPPLERAAELKNIAEAIDARASCFLIGDSGTGKSALAKAFASARYRRILWLNGDMLDHASLPDFEKDIGLSHSIAELVESTVDSTIIVFDGVEGFSERARKVAAQLLHAIRSTAAAARVHVIATAQAERIGALSSDLYSVGFPIGMLEFTPVDRPAEEAIKTMVSGLPKVGWVALTPEVRALLTNLKMLDWFVQFARTGGTLDTENVGLTNLIDALWRHWIENGSDRFAKSGLLKQIATIEADRHISAVPVSALGHAEQTTLGKLSDSELIRVSNERIQFAHDLLSDWSRLKVLVGEDWLATPAARDRYALPRWYRAIRLYGQRLLEQSSDHGESWREQLDALGDDTSTDVLIRDLFLEALFVAPNAAALLWQAWPVLTANDGKLLKLLLERFLYSATLPDPRLPFIVAADEDVSTYEHLMRYPYIPYWIPLIAVLYQKRDEVVSLAPHEAAKVCVMWLRTMRQPGFKFVGRSELASLAYAIARQAQFNDIVRAHGMYGGSRTIYEALILASEDMPNEVGTLCLELANRRDLDPAVASKVAEFRAAQREERNKDAVASSKRRSVPPPVFSLQGPIREPWPDGPRSRVDHAFIEACLDGNCFDAFAASNPDAALEVLLAVCIEAPQHEPIGPQSLPDLGVSYWRKGEPAIWFRGPFLALLNASPEHGLTFVIKLTNFATERHARDQGMTINIEGTPRRWLGDPNLFALHYDGYVAHSSILQCALMALERWFYLRMDRGEEITDAIARIMNEGQSLAFAGLLLTIAKRRPELFVQALAPLLECWMLVERDLQLTLQRDRGWSAGFGYWGHEPQQAVNIAQEWVDMPHRKLAVRDMLARELLPKDEHTAFFERLVVIWEKDLSKDRRPLELRRLVESLRKSNYEFGEVDGKVVPIDFHGPVEDEAEDAELYQKATKDLLFSTFPMKCRRLLDAGNKLPVDQIKPFFEMIKGIHEDGEDLNEDGMYRPADLVLGGVAILVNLHYEWLGANPQELAWCRDRLNDTLGASIPNFHHWEINHGNDKWDAFAAECGVSLLTRDRADQLARKLVAQAITGSFYSTTHLAVDRAVQNCNALGDDFRRIVVAVLEWSALRPLAYVLVPALTDAIEQWSARKSALEMRFVDGSLTPALPDLKQLNADARAELDAIHARRNPEHAAFLKSQARGHHGLGSRIELYPESLGFDVHLIRAGLFWMRPDAVTPISRSEIVATIQTLLEIVIESLPKISDRKTEEISGLPSEFDSWVYELVATAIPLLTATEKPENLWKPILSLDSPAHEWVERFYWQWFTHGWKAKPDFVAFFHEWRAMIEFALASPQWDPKTNYHHDIDDVVYELLGFKHSWSNWSETDGIGPFIDGMIDVYARAAARWFSLPKILGGFSHFASCAAASKLAVKAIPWIAAAVQDYTDYNWRYGAEESLIEFLSTCWSRHAEKIVPDTALRNAFFETVKILAARGNHAALALQDRVNARATK